MAAGNDRAETATATTGFPPGSAVLGSRESISGQYPALRGPLPWGTDVRLPDPLELLADGAPLVDVLNALCLRYEAAWPESICSVLILHEARPSDPDQTCHLRFAAGPSIPAAYSKAVDGARAAEGVGSCGTAAARCTRIISVDIATDPFWTDYRAFAAAHELAACWSSPILDARGIVLGTFAVYYREPRIPSASEIAFIDQVTYLAKLAIQTTRRERALDEKSALLKMAGKMAKLGGWELDLAHNTLHGTDELYDLLEAPSNEKLDLVSALTLCDVHDRQDLADDLSRCAKHGIPFERETALRTFKGRSILVRATGVAERDSEGRIVRVRGAFQDITDRRATDTQLRLLQNAIAHLNDLVIIGDVSGDVPRIVFVNDAFVAKTGFTREEVIGQSRMALFTHRSLDAAAQIGEALREWRPVCVEMNAKTKSGEDLWLEVDVSPLADRRHWVSVSRDIGARRAAEARIAEQAAVLEHAREAIFICGPAGEITYWNRGAEALYGWSAAEVVGASPALFQGDPEVLEGALAALHDGGAWTGEFLHRTKDGRTLVVESHLSLIREPLAAEPAPPNTPTGHSYLAITSDVTERRQLEQQLLRSQRMESIGTLAGGIAHDLNNMLAPIVLSIGVLKETAAPEDHDLFAAMETSVLRSTGMVRQLLGFARGVDGGRSKLLHPRTIVEEVLTLARDTFPKNLDFEVRIADDVATLHGDPTLLYQVLLNLCVNARDAMPNGGTLTIEAYNRRAGESCFSSESASCPASGRAEVVFAVTDTGTGIAPEIRERIFDPFFTTKPHGAGTGLGLPSVLGIAKSHGGSVHVASNPGEPTRFEVRLPAGDRRRTARPARPSEPGGIAALPRDFAERRLQVGATNILVVDDDAAVRAVTARALSSFGYTVLSASDATEALAIIAASKRGPFADAGEPAQGAIALVITDMMMPGIDGIALAAALANLSAEIPVIGTSGLATGERLVAAEAAGIRYFLAKPFDADILLRTVQWALAAKA